MFAGKGNAGLQRKKFSAVILNGVKDLTLADWSRRLPCVGWRLDCGVPRFARDDNAQGLGVQFFYEHRFCRSGTHGREHGAQIERSTISHHRCF